MKESTVKKKKKSKSQQTKIVQTEEGVKSPKPLKMKERRIDSKTSTKNTDKSWWDAPKNPLQAHLDPIDQP